MKNLTLLSLLFLCLALSSQEAFTIRNYQVTINVSEDGTMRVTEDMDVDFSEERHGIIHKIPYKYNVDDRPYSLTITDVDVTGAPVQTRRESHDITLRIGDGSKYVIGSQDYKIEYTVAGAITNYTNHDEFFWNVIGTKTDAEIDQASFTIRFPNEWRDSVYEYEAYAGRAGTQDSNILVAKNGAQFSGAITQPLGPREGITLAVKIPKGLIQYASSNTISHDPTVQEIQNTPLWKKLLFSIPFAITGLMLYLYQLLGRQKDNESGPLQYFPPHDLTPAEVGTFYDYKVNRRDIISLLPYWGELGYVKIKPIEGKDGDMSFYKLQDIADNRPAYEQEFFKELFSDGDTILLSDLTNSFYTTMNKVSKNIKQEVEDLNLYDQNSMTAGTKWKIVGMGLAIIVLGIIIIAALQSFLVGGITIFLGLVSIFLTLKNRKFSDLGTETHRHLVGLRTWLKDPDPQQLNTILDDNPNYLSQIFPYVLAFGLDKSWEKRFDDLSIPPPIWYDYNHMGGTNSAYNYGQFTKDFQPHKIEQVFYSTPAPPPGTSSGGGFSSGGGSVGGGFGGSSTSSW